MTKRMEDIKRLREKNEKALFNLKNDTCMRRKKKKKKKNK